MHEMSFQQRSGNNPARYRKPAVVLGAFLVFTQLAFSADSKKASLQTVTQQFQDATKAVIASAQDFFGKMNVVEQNGTIDRLAIERQPINYAEVGRMQIITPEELKVRIDALNVLASYTTDLASVATGSSMKTFGDNLTTLNTNLNQLATDAAALPSVPANSFLKNKEFAGILSGAVKAVGAIVALITGRHAQDEIKKEVLEKDKDLTAIITLIGDEMREAYQRQHANTSQREEQLTRLYNESIKGPDVFLSVTIARQIEASMAQTAAIESTDPRKSIDAMEKAHTAMAQYVTSGKKGADISSLVNSVGTFFSAAKSSGGTAKPSSPAATK